MEWKGVVACVLTPIKKQSCTKLVTPKQQLQLFMLNLNITLTKKIQLRLQRPPIYLTFQRYSDNLKLRDLKFTKAFELESVSNGSISQ
jgi:hypothetical protein